MNKPGAPLGKYSELLKSMSHYIRALYVGRTHWLLGESFIDLFLSYGRVWCEKRIRWTNI